MEIEDSGDCDKGTVNAAVKDEASDGCGAGAFFSNDFEWETLRAEVEGKGGEEYDSVCFFHRPEIGRCSCTYPGRNECHGLLSGKCGDDDRYFPEDEAPAFEIDHIYLSEPPKCAPPNPVPDPRGRTLHCPVSQLADAGSGDTFGHRDSVSRDFPSSAWEAFHKSHSKALFFKERRYLVKEFPELLSASNSARILEVGCGTGSSVVPILRANKKAIVYGCDCSTAALQRAAELVTQQTDSAEEKIQRFQPILCDIFLDALPAWLCCSACRRANLNEEQFTKCTQSKICPSQACRLPPGQHCLGGVNIVTLIFTLSSIPPENMLHVITEILSVLRPGGRLLFRDYGLYDLTMLRFPTSQKVSKRLYHRKDGTLSYFFSLQFVKDLFTKVGLLEDELHYCCVQLRNRRTQCLMRRVWVHAVFKKSEI